MLRKSLILALLVSLFFSCQSNPERENLKSQLSSNEDLLDSLEGKADDIDDEYEDIKEDLTELMQREGFLTRRLVREKRRFIKYSNQKEKLSNSIKDQEERAVDQDLVDINKEILVYIEDVITETSAYIEKLEKELLDVTNEGLAMRTDFQKFQKTRQDIHIQISETKSIIGEIQQQLDQ